MSSGQLSHLMQSRRRLANMTPEELLRHKERKRIYDKNRYEKMKGK